MSLLSLMEIFWWCLSPYGVLLSKCIKLQWNSELRERGSVPSRGLSYLNYKTMMEIIKNKQSGGKSSKKIAEPKNDRKNMRKGPKIFN